MTLLSVLLRTLFLILFVSVLPGAVAYIFGGREFALAALAVGCGFLFLEATRADARMRKILKPSTIEIGGDTILAIEDPSSHVFATQAFFAVQPTLWITRGALSLLAPEEIVTLLKGMRTATRGGGLRFETFLTSMVIRLTSKIPSGFRDILFFREKRTKSIHIRESARAAFWTSLVLVMECFYLRRSATVTWLPEEILRKLEAESRRCVPRLPAALSSHSAVAPWPDAFITLGRPCLRPSSGVNLRA